MINVTHVGTETVFDLQCPTGQNVPVEVRLGFRSDDPYAVSMDLRADNHTTWVVSRELLADGLLTLTGTGDVSLRPLSEESAVLELGNGDVRVTFHVSTADLQRFLDMTRDLVAPGEEAAHLDIDAVIGQLLAS